MTTASLAPVETLEIPAAPLPGDGIGIKPDPRLLSEIKVTLEARLGMAEITVKQLLELKTGSLVSLGTGLGDYIELRLNDILIARGEIVAVDEHFGLRISEIIETK